MEDLCRRGSGHHRQQTLLAQGRASRLIARLRWRWASCCSRPSGTWSETSKHWSMTHTLLALHSNNAVEYSITWKCTSPRCASFSVFKTSRERVRWWGEGLWTKKKKRSWNFNSNKPIQVKPLYNVPLYNVYLFIKLHRGMFLQIIAWITSLYNVHL